MMIHHGNVSAGVYIKPSRGDFLDAIGSSYNLHDSRARIRHAMCMAKLREGKGLFKPLTVKDDYDDTGIRWKPEEW